MLYKVLGLDGRPIHGGRGVWPLPVRNEDGTWTPGEWLRVKGELVPCRNALHLCREGDLLEWLGSSIYEAEYRGEMVELDDKIVVREARLIRQLSWDERTARLFACDCAERVLPLYEQAYPEDRRPRTAIETARRYANGEADRAELTAASDAAEAAWDAAWDAAEAAAWDAAWDAAWAAARAAAWDAAWDAAWAAARAADAAAAAAARDAAWAAEAAAAAAAAKAAWADAARAADAAAAARDAAWAAEAAAAADAAAERRWQRERLLAYLYGRLDEPSEEEQ